MVTQLKIVTTFTLCYAVIFAAPQLQTRSKITKRSHGLYIFNVHAHEKGVLVEEKVGVDEDKQLVSFYVPGHNDLVESEFIHDFKNNLTIMVFPKQKTCYVAPLDKTEVQDPETTVTALEAEATEGDEPVVAIESNDYNIVGAPGDAEDLLPEYLVPWCKDFTVYRAMKMKESISVDETDDSRRKRREVPAMTIIEDDSCNLCMKPQCVVRTRHCQFIVLCRTVTNKFSEIVPDCTKKQEVHKFYNVNQCTPCCHLEHNVYFPPIQSIGYPGGNVKCSDVMTDKPKSSYPNCKGV